MIFTQRSIDVQNMASSPPMLSSLPRRSHQIQSNGGILDPSVKSLQDRATLEQHARAFFRLVNVCDRRESRYNAHGNRSSFQGQKHKLYRNVFVGSEAIDDMVASGLASSREEALKLGNQLSHELNLFSRANSHSLKNGGSAPRNQIRTKGRTRANLLTAQTILLGTNSESGTPSGATNVAFEDYFADDADAFYRFGPGVLVILREIDHDCHLSWIDGESESEDTSLYSGVSGEDYQTNNKGGKRSLSITPNAPGCNGKIALEDLFTSRNRATNDRTKAPQDGTTTSKSSKSNKKGTKKAAAVPNPSISSQPPFPKPILKNNNNNSTNKKKKHKASRNNKTKGNNSKKKTHKIKAGAKIKYISEKERRIASIEKRLLICHSKQQVIKYKRMLSELEGRLSRLYTGNHKIVASMSPPRTPIPNHRHRPNPIPSINIENESTIEGMYSNNNDDCSIDVDNWNDNFVNTLENLDDIISSNSDLLADDNTSVWTQFILGTSHESDPPNANANAKTKSNEMSINTENSLSSTSKANKLSKENSPNKLRVLSAVIESEQPEIQYCPTYQQQHQKKKRREKTCAGWQAPSPLESGGDDTSQKRNNKNCERNEIDLSSWAMIINKRVETKPEDPIKNSPSRPNHRLTTGIGQGTQSSNTTMKNIVGNSILLQNDAQDDISIWLEQQQKRERKCLQEQFRADPCTSKSTASTEHNHCHHSENFKNVYPRSLPSGTTTCTDLTTESIRSSTTMDSIDLVRLRLRLNPSSEMKFPREKELIATKWGATGEDSRQRKYHTRDSNGEGANEPPLKSVGDSCNDSVETNSDSGIMEAIENDPFYQLAVNKEEVQIVKCKTIKQNSKEGAAKNQSNVDAIVTGIEPASFAESVNDSYFDESNDESVEDDTSYETDDDEESYMELTVNEDEDEDSCYEVIEEEIIEDEQTSFEEIPPLSVPNYSHDQNHKTVCRPILSPRRKLQSARSLPLPSVPELGPEAEPEPEPQPTSPKREESVYVEVRSMPDDDEMTQITMDFSSFRSNRSLHIIPEDDYTINNDDYTNHNSYLYPSSNLIRTTKNTSSQLVPSSPGSRQKNQFASQQHRKQRTKQVTSSAPSSAKARCRKTVCHMETSKERIQEILWKELSSSDIAVLWSALEELRNLIAIEASSRAFLVRHGGVMVIIETMAEQLEVEAVQFLCCTVLEQLASVDVEIGLTIVELGGVSLIQNSVKKHGGSLRVKEISDSILRTLLRHS